MEKVDEQDYEIVALENELRGAQKDLMDDLKSTSYSPRIKEKRERFLLLYKQYLGLINARRRRLDKRGGSVV